MDQLFILLTVEKTAALIALLGALFIFGVVIFLVSSSNVDEEKHAAKDKVYKIRTIYFIVLALFLVSAMVITFRTLPYPRFQSKPDETITIVGVQWSWKMAPGSSPKDPKDFSGENEITLPVNKKIEFLVTSADVNHDFSIYDSKGVLLIQTQAMPDYYNRLQYVFTKKGDYRVVCLEYCGAGHPLMSGEIHVE